MVSLNNRKGGLKALHNTQASGNGSLAYFLRGLCSSISTTHREQTQYQMNRKASGESRNISGEFSSADMPGCAAAVEGL
jgi:hypothetical protein